MAALTIASLPVIIVYMIFREKIIQGFVAGAVRG
jgi:ABC-type glycerol-3-phosphate transport system permease component